MSPRDPPEHIGVDDTISADEERGVPTRDVGAGQRVGRYLLGERIGAGGMGVVYRARDPDLGRDVAIKVVRALAGTDARSRLFREAQAMARLRHRAVIPVFDVGTAGDDIFIAMPLLEGGTLGAWCRAEPRPWRDVLDRFVAAGEGLAAAHLAGLIHRDFKPENVLLDGDGEVQVADFGLARLGVDVAPPAPSSSDGFGSDGLTIAGAVVGTPAYMAPEQLRGEPIDARSDQFSFCVALWEGLHGVRPFATPLADSTDVVAELVAAIDAGAIIEPTTTQLPPRLRAVLRRGLAASPDDRWVSMEELLHELRDVTARRRWPLVAVGLGVAAAGTLAGVMLLGDEPSAIRAAPPPVETAAPRLRVVDESVRRLTVEAGCEEFPSFTPDGKTILYDGAVPEGYAIFALDVASRQSRRLTHFDGWDYAPAVSPDGTRFAFIRNSPGSAVWIAPFPEGEPARKLADGGFRPSWSTDPRFVWGGRGARPTRLDADTGAEHSHVVAPQNLLALVGVEGADGQLLAAIFAKSGQGMGLALLAPGAAPRWIMEAWFEEALVALPGREGVLASRMTTGGSPLVMQAGFDGTLEPLAIAEVAPRKGITMTPDGRRVAWSTCHEDEKMAFLATAADGKRRLDNVAAGEWNDRDPAAIPGTSQLVLASDRGGMPELWVTDVTGAIPARRLPSDAVRATGIAVSPDGKWVVYSGGSNDAAGEGLVVLPIDGDGPRRPLTRSAQDSSPAVSADGYVYFDRAIDPKRWDVMRIPLAGGDAETVLENADSPKVSADGTLLLYQKGNVPRIRDLTTGRDERLLKQATSTGYARGAFSADGTRVAIITNNRLTVIDRATGQIIETFDSGVEQLTGVAFAGDRLVLGRLRWEGDLWLADLAMTR